MRAALYLRVSTDKQDVENQRGQLIEFCQRQGWQIVATYTDEAQSGAKGDRPALREMLQGARKKKFDILLFWSLDRFSRQGVLATILQLTELESYGIRFVSFTEPYLSSLGPFRDAIIALLAALAKQERLRLSERVIAGMLRAKSEGRRLGRPPLDSGVVEEILKLRNDRLTYGQIAKKLGRRRGSISGICRRASQKGSQKGAPEAQKIRSPDGNFESRETKSF